MTILNVLKLLADFQEDNLRVLSFYIDVLRKLHPFIKSRPDHLQDDVITFCTIFSITFKSGDPFNVYSIPAPLVVTKPFFFAVKIEGRKTEEPMTDDNQFYDKFLKGIVQNYHFFQTIYDFIFTGYLDEEMFKKELEAMVAVELEPHEKAMMVLFHNHNYRNLSDAKFSE